MDTFLLQARHHANPPCLEMQASNSLARCIKVLRYVLDEHNPSTGVCLQHGLKIRATHVASATPLRSSPQLLHHWGCAKAFGQQHRTPSNKRRRLNASSSAEPSQPFSNVGRLAFPYHHMLPAMCSSTPVLFAGTRHLKGSRSP